MELKNNILSKINFVTYHKHNLALIHFFKVSLHWKQFDLPMWILTMLMSSSIKPNVWALLVSSSVICWDTNSLWVINSEASNLAYIKQKYTVKCCNSRIPMLSKCLVILLAPNLSDTQNAVLTSCYSKIVVIIVISLSRLLHKQFYFLLLRMPKKFRYFMKNESMLWKMLRVCYRNP